MSLSTALHTLCCRFYRKSKDNSFLSLKRHYNQGARQIIVEIPTLKPSCVTLFQKEKIKKGGKKANKKTSIFAQATLEKSNKENTAMLHGSLTTPGSHHRVCGRARVLIGV